MRLAISSSPLTLSFPTPAIAQTHGHLRKFSNPKISTTAPPRHYSQKAPCDSHDADNSSPAGAKTIRFRLSELCRNGQVHLARQLFDAIPQPTTVLWNTLIIGYICNSMPDEAISLYSRLICTPNSSDDRKCDVYTYSSVLKACAETKQVLIGKSVHCHLLRSNIYPSRIVYNSLLNMYASNSHGHNLVEKMFTTMPKRNVVSWNTMISWYAKTGRFEEAVRHLVMMMKIGFEPTAVTFVNVFPAVSGLRDIEMANVVYGMVMKLGYKYADDLFVVSSAITMYADLGLLDSGRKVFDNCLKKNSHVWNCMIGGYVQNNFPVLALELFIKALEARDVNDIDNVTFLLALMAASDLQRLDFAQQMHSYLIKNSLFSCIILANAVISLYSKCNSIGNSFKAFIGMLERDVVSWTTMICSLVQNGLDNEGFMLVHEMQKLGVSFDDVTITALLSLASNLRNQEIGKQTHAYLIRHGIQFSGMESYLIDMYAKSGFVKGADIIFTKDCKGSRDLAVWNAIISGSVQNGLVEQSLIIFQKMVGEKVRPNAVTLSSIIPACSHLGSVGLGKQLHGFSIRNLLDQNMFVGSALVDMYSKSGSITYAERTFIKSPEKNSVTCTNMILGYGQHGMSEKALLLFNSMRDFGISPDAITLVAILSACSYSGLINEGLEIFESMESEYGIKPSTEHYACVVDMLGRVGKVVEAYEFVLKLDKEGEVLGIWGSLLAACKIHQNFELGKVVAKKLFDMEGTNTTGYHVLLSNIHAEKGHWEDVKSVRKEMVKRGLKKEVGCSWVDITGHVSCFVSRDREHPQCDGIYDLLKHLCANMKDVGYMPPFSCEWERSIPYIPPTQ